MGLCLCSWLSPAYPPGCHALGYQVTSHPLISTERDRKVSPPFTQRGPPPLTWTCPAFWPSGRAGSSKEARMGSSFAVGSLLLPLALLLLSVGSQTQLIFRMRPPEKRNVRPSEKVQLQCETLSFSQTGCSWLRLAPGAQVPTFLLFISGNNPSVKRAEGLDPTRFGGERISSSTYRLTLNNFRDEDQGHYYCVVTRNSALFFSPSVPVFLPVKATTTPAPKPKTTTLLATTSSSIQISDSEKCKSILRKQEKKGLDFSCDLYIWMPLTGVCVVLLLALITTITICQRSRKRVCRCPRPLVRPGGKSAPSERYV
ncbi:T-cell surface glycoprotein CD8 alpha chain [Trichosurus vulpecula]|uniref:T-cell surface glycoprotein CD8 alpha chain n=1 Tax=Trichosurus vulpecula TaxID=9337 RepID=UPI00186AC906|nr:T-cell surface glycoprotein CD8 alpha chain [Trichosurus vulpecula]